MCVSFRSSDFIVIYYAMPKLYNISWYIPNYVYVYRVYYVWFLRFTWRVWRWSFIESSRACGYNKNDKRMPICICLKLYVYTYLLYTFLHILCVYINLSSWVLHLPVYLIPTLIHLYNYSLMYGWVRSADKVALCISIRTYI